MIGKLIPHYQNTIITGSTIPREVKKTIHIPFLVHLEISGVGCPTPMGQFQFNPFRDIIPGGTLLGIKLQNWWFKDNTVVGILLKLIFDL